MKTQAPTSSQGPVQNYQNCPSTFHQGTQDTSGTIHETLETSSCVPTACLAETWVGSNGAPPIFQRCCSYWSLPYHCLFHWNVKCSIFQIAAMKHDFKTELEPFKSAMPFKRRWPSVSSGKMQHHLEQLGNLSGSTSGRSIFSSKSWSCITCGELRERFFWRLASLQTASVTGG